MLCNRLHKFENVLSQVVTLEIWNPTFKNIDNRLHALGNRLLLCKIVIKLFGLLVINYQRVKSLVKDFSLEKLWYSIFSLKKYFYTYLDAFLEVLAYLESSLESWFLIERLFDFWNLLESWFLTWVFGIIKISLEALLPHLHHIIPCILLRNQSFALCLHILVNVEPTQQVRSIREYSFHCIHQRQIPVSDNNPGECINSHEKTPKPL